VVLAATAHVNSSDYNNTKSNNLAALIARGSNFITTTNGRRQGRWPWYQNKNNRKLKLQSKVLVTIHINGITKTKIF